MKNKSAIGVGTKYKIDNQKKGQLTDHTTIAIRIPVYIRLQLSYVLAKIVVYKSSFIQ